MREVQWEAVPTWSQRLKEGKRVFDVKPGSHLLVAAARGIVACVFVGRDGGDLPVENILVMGTEPHRVSLGLVAYAAASVGTHSKNCRILLRLAPISELSATMNGSFLPSKVNWDGGTQPTSTLQAQSGHRQLLLTIMRGSVPNQVGHLLHSLGNEGQRARRPLVGVLLAKAKEFGALDPRQGRGIAVGRSPRQSALLRYSPIF